MDRENLTNRLPIVGLGQDEQQRIRNILARLNDEGWGDAEINIGGETGISSHVIENEDFEDACEASESVLQFESMPAAAEDVVRNKAHQAVTDPSYQESRDKLLDAQIESSMQHLDTGDTGLPVTPISAENDSQNNVPPASLSVLPAESPVSDASAAFGQQIVPKPAPPAAEAAPTPTELAGDPAAAAADADDGGGGGAGTLLERLLKRAAAAEPAPPARAELPDVQVTGRRRRRLRRGTAAAAPGGAASLNPDNENPRPPTY